MATVRLSSRAFAHLEAIFEFIASTDAARALRTVQRIREAVMILERHPMLGRPVEQGRRELVIGRGRDCYLALYRWLPGEDTVLVLAVRDAREAGYRE